MFLTNLLSINYVMVLYTPLLSQICVCLLCVGDKGLRAEHFVSSYTRKTYQMLSHLHAHFTDVIWTGNIITGTEGVPPAWRNEVKRVIGVNPTLTWNEKLEGETVFASSQGSCKKREGLSHSRQTEKKKKLNANGIYGCIYSDYYEHLCV